MIIFKKVSWKNFLSTGNVFTTIKLNETTTTILTGESGSGKSTLLDAITFALFNKPFRSINKNNIVNSVNEKDCLVEIEFDVGKKEYLIRRGIKPNIFEIYCDGVLFNQDASARDYQGFLEKQILKFNYRSFTQIVVLGASNFTPFMLLKQAERRAIIEELLDIQIFSVMNLLMKQRVSSLKTMTDDNERNISLLNEKILLHEKYLKELEDDKQNKINDNQEKIDSHNIQIQKFENFIQEQRKVIESYQSMLSFEEKLNEKLKELVMLETKIVDSVKKLGREVTFYESHDDCPTCKQSIDSQFKNTEIIKKKDKIKESEKALEDIDSKVAKLNEKKEKADELRNKIAEIESVIADKNTQVMAAKAYIKKLEKEIVDLNKPKSRVAEEVAALDDFRNEIMSLEKNKEYYANEKNLHELANGLLKDTGIKSLIIKQYLPLINKFTNKYLNTMSFNVSFNMNENFEEQIKSRGRDDFVYGNFSDGEKQRLDLALLFTWREIAKLKNSVNTNLLILDEIADSYLDLETTENIIQLLTSSIFGGMNIIVISHKNTISDKFNRVIKFKKEKNFSKIVP